MEDADVWEVDEIAEIRHIKILTDKVLAVKSDYYPNLFLAL